MTREAIDSDLECYGGFVDMSLYLRFVVAGQLDDQQFECFRAALPMESRTEFLLETMSASDDEPTSPRLQRVGREMRDLFNGCV